jgi:hypothetical protein
MLLCYASEFVSEIRRFVTPCRCVCNDAVRRSDGREEEHVRITGCQADDAAAHGDHADAIGWLRAVEAIGDELSAAYRLKLHVWLLALAADRSEGPRFAI